MKHITVFVLLTLMILPQAIFSFGQETVEAKKTDQKSDKKEKKKGVISNFWSDHAKILTSPLRIKTKDLITLGSIGLVTGILIHNDEMIYRKIKDFQAKTPLVDNTSPFFSTMCQGIPFGVAGLLILDGLAFKDKKALDTGSMALQAMFHSFIVVQLVKHLSGRTRPSFTNGVDEWAGPSGFFKRYEDGQWAHYDAWFSGHTITIWALATVLAKQYNKTPLIPILSYSLATLGGMATVTEDLHWVSDVFIGAIVGYAIASFVIKQHKQRNFQITPTYGKKQFGISLSISF